jgi:hypothetical protein
MKPYDDAACASSMHLKAWLILMAESLPCHNYLGWCGVLWSPPESDWRGLNPQGKDQPKMWLLCLFNGPLFPLQRYT